MRKTIFIFMVSLLFFLPHFSALAATVNGVSFSIVKTSRGQWTKPRHHLLNDAVVRADEGNEALAYIAISYLVENTNDKKKIDLDANMEYKLFDDLGNRYRAMRKPEDYKESVLIVSKNFPSLYPGEKYGETVFFEAPLPAAKQLKLVLAPKSFGATDPIELPVSLGSLGFGESPLPVVTSHVALAPAIATAPQPVVSQGQRGIGIAFPEQGVVWDQGQAGRLNLVVSGGAVPRKIIIIALDHTLEDRTPGISNVYDINVPLEQPVGAYTLNVIAEWPDGEILSDTLKFYVKDSIPLSVL